MNIYKKYAQVRSKLEKLQDLKITLEAQMKEELKNLSEPMKTEWGTFTTRKTSSWTYSKAVDNKKKEIKKLQKEEQEKGVAKKEENVSVIFMPLKEGVTHES